MRRDHDGGKAGVMAPVRTEQLFCIAATVLRLLLLTGLATAMASCRTAGDFGRQKPSYFYDQVVPSIRATVGDYTGVPNSDFPLTGAEQELRARNLAIVENEGPSTARLIDQKAVAYGIHEGTYQKERRVEHSSGTPDLADEEYPRHPRILLSAVAEDLGLLRGFAAVAEEVYRTDKKRLKTLRQGGDVPAEDVLDTTGRVKENRAIVENTILALHNRIDDYEIELRRSILAYPDGEKASVDNAIGRLANRLGRFEKTIRGVSDPTGIKHHPDLMG